MLFYTSLFVASLFMALVLLWFYRSLLSVGRAVSQAILPSSKDNLTDHIKDTELPTTVNPTPTPWGWQGHSTPAQVARGNVALPDERVPATQPVPWGWKGNKPKVREYRVKEGIPLIPAQAGPNAGAASRKLVNPGLKHPEWPDKVEKFEFAGATYKVTRKVKPKKSNLQNVSKPWGW